jgi:hypothetical protein
MIEQNQLLVELSPDRYQEKYQELKEEKESCLQDKFRLELEMFHSLVDELRVKKDYCLVEYGAF